MRPEPFLKTLQGLGYIEGRNLVIDRRWAEGEDERFAALAVELVALKPDAIVADTTPGVIAAMRATATIPIVMVNVADPRLRACSEPCAPTAATDERKIRQVVLNLLSNAIKFTPEGGSIEVRAVPKDGFVEVSVSDTGVGIAPEDQDAIFEEFRQVGTADKKAEGTGLGLTLCRKFIELHGGRIWVKSQVGAGSMFTFTIPVHPESSDREGALH
jgi:signal transduction histidine kinase